MKVAVVGVGVMGFAIANRLIDSGVVIFAYDPMSNNLSELAQRGGQIMGSAEAATEAADFVITSLNSAAVVENAVFGDKGIAASATGDKLLVDMSSIDAGRTAELAKRLRRDTGMGWVDAPLSGGAPAAAKGMLTLMLGGEETDVTRATPLLSLLASKFTHFGNPGAGQTVKLINQILCACGFVAVAEAVRFAEAHGVDATQIPAALAGGRADSKILQEFMGKMAVRDYTPTGRIDNMLKDLETVQASAFYQRIPMPITSLITDLHRILVAGGLGAADSAEYMKLFSLGRNAA